jgi:pyrroloquinoline quinone biosynthesis protein B
VYATRRVLEGLSANAVLRTLERFPGHVVWRTLEPGSPCELVGPDGERSRIQLAPFALPGKPPLHLAALPPSPEDNLGLRLSELGGSGEGSLVYASAVASLADLPPELDGCSALLMDGTFWSEDELPGQGIGSLSARSMAHLPISGAAGSLAALAPLRIGQRVYTHVNNTNPILDPAAPERLAVEAAGWSVATDGLKLAL